MKSAILLGALLAASLAWLSQREAPRLGPQSQNWDQTVQFAPRDGVASPRSVPELQALVQQAERVKAVGAGHSWNAVAEAPGLQLCLDQLEPRGVLAVDLDAMTVRASAGMRLFELTAALEAHEPPLAFPALPSVRDQSLGGLIATATHSTGVGGPNLSAYLVAARLVAADGSLVEVPAGSKLLPAVRVALGALGVLTEVTLRVVPNFHLQQTDTVLPTGYILDHAAELARSGDHVKFWLFPHADRGVVTAKDHVPLSTPLRETRPRWVKELLTWPQLGLQWIGAVFPQAAAPINRFLIGYTFPNATRVARHEDVFNVPFRITRHAETEWAVPLASAADVVRDVLAYIEDEARIGVNHIVEVRFVQPDPAGADGWLSPNPAAPGVDAWCHVTLLLAWPELQPDVERAYFARLRETALRLGGRPHWAKTIDVGHEQLRPLFPHWDDFLAARDRLDPGRKFGNAFLEQVLGA